MRVAIVTDWFAPRQGGIETQLAELSTQLAGAGHDVTVLTSTYGAEQRSPFRVVRLPIMTLPRLELAVSPYLIPEIRSELRRGYDVVHAHASVVSPVAYAGAVVARSLGLPTLITFHSILRHKARAIALADIFIPLARTAVVWSAVSNIVADQLRRGIRDADVEVLPNGADLSFWAAARSARAELTGGDITVVSAMRLHRKKRPLALLRAFARAASRVKRPARLVIVGDGAQRAALRDEIRALGLNSGARIDLLPWRDRSELRDLYRRAHLFATASDRESFGIAALEARAAGLPVVAMAAAGSSDFLRDGHDSVLCRDDTELSDAIARLIEDEGLRRRLAAAESALEPYDWSSVLRSHETAYARAIVRARTAAQAAVQPA